MEGHIALVSSDGDSTWENLTGACRSCNNSKGKKALLIFLLGCNTEAMPGSRSGVTK